MEHRYLRMSLDPVIGPECGADETDAIDEDNVVLQEMHIGKLYGCGVTVLKSFPDRALIVFMIASDVDARHRGCDVFRQPIHAIGGRPA